MKTKIVKKFLAAILSISMLLQIGGPVVYSDGGEENNRTETQTQETRTITGFADLSEEVKDISVDIGTAEEELSLPETLTARVQYDVYEEEVVEISETKVDENIDLLVTWNSDMEFSSESEGEFVFIAKLEDESYILADDLEMPKIVVSVVESVVLLNDAPDVVNDDNIPNDSKGTTPASRMLGRQGDMEITSGEASGLGYVFNFINSGAEVEITGYTGSGGDIVIPSKIDEKPVTSIGEQAFSRKNLTNVIIPETVTSIGGFAFHENQLVSVEIPSTLTSIGSGVFHTNQLTSVVIPEGVTSIAGSAFSTNKLTSIVIPEGVTSIGACAFERNQLTSIEIPDGVTSIGWGAFMVNQLTSVDLPSGINKILTKTFTSNKLTSVKIPSGVTSIENDAFSYNQSNSKDLTVYGGLGSSAEDHANLNRYNFIPMLSLDKINLYLKKDATKELTATVLPEDKINKEIAWSSNEESIATVENGSVKAVSKGEATITATTIDGNYKATCKVNVVDWQPYELTLARGKDITGTGYYKVGDKVSITADAPSSVETFSGWESNKGGTFLDSTMKETEFTMPAADTTVTAKYKITTTYTVTFKAGDNGSLTGETTYNDILAGTKWSEALTMPTPEPDEGYKFAGWTPSLPTTVTEDATYTAKFIDEASKFYSVELGDITISKGTNIDTLKVTHGSGFTEDNIPADTELTITGQSTNHSVEIKDGVTANIIFNNLSIIGEKTVKIIDGSNVNLTLVGENILGNTLIGGGVASAGLAVSNGNSLTVTEVSKGSLIATGGVNGAGIGGSIKDSAGTITIQGGEVTANGGSGGSVNSNEKRGGAGIGGGMSGSGGIINITGGIVIANGESGGSGIGGGGESGSGGNITISGGIVSSTGSRDAAGIGGGIYGSGGEVTINGGIVNATATLGSGAGIGGGRDGSGGKVTINGGIINAKGDSSGAGIGGAGKGSGGTVVVTGGFVNAIGGKVGIGGSSLKDVNGIGGGHESKDPGYFTAKDNAFVVATNIGDGGYKNNPTSQGIIFDDDEGVIYGAPTIASDATIPEGKTLTVRDGKSITANSGLTLTNNGTLIVAGGSLQGEGVISGAGKFISLNDIAVTLSSDKYTGGIINSTISITKPTILNWVFNSHITDESIRFEKQATKDDWSVVTEIKDVGNYRAMFESIVLKEFSIATASKKNSGESSGGSSSGGSKDDTSKDEDRTKDKDTTKVETTKEADAPTKVIVSTSSTVTKDTANVQLDKNTVKDAIKKAQAATKKNGTEKDGISVEIKVDTRNIKANNISANIGKSTLEDLTKAGVKNLSINSDIVLISLDLETLKKIQGEIKTDINFSAKKVEKSTLSPEVQEMVGSRPVFDFSITGTNGEKLSKFGKGKVSISLPYSLGVGEKTANLVIYYINDQGKVEEMSNSLYDKKKGTISFETDLFSKFAVGYKEDVDIVTFTDIENHWAKDDIEFVTARGLFTGTGQDKFSPDMPMTRGMFVTVLGRLENADVSSYKASRFTDVKADAYYMPYIQWANQMEIVKGIKQDEFAPDMPLSREQMAVILYRYSQYKSYDTTQGGMAIREFEDYEAIEDYALQAMAWTVNTGLIKGSNTNIMPKESATRAQLAAILMRFSQEIEK